MCFPGAEVLTALGGAALQGAGHVADARYQAATAKHQGREARLATQRRVTQLEREGTRELGALRARMAGSGNLSWLEFLGDGSRDLGLEIAWTKRDGTLAKAEARSAAARARQLGLRAVAGTALNVGTQLLSGVNGGTPWRNPAVVSRDVYGQPGRYGSALHLTDRDGRLIGGI